MKKKNITALIDWYQKNKRDLPWRKKPDPYWVWLAEVMSQQTQMSALVPYFYRFIEAFSTVQDLARAPEEDVMKMWAGLGYYSRARNVHKTAQIIVNERKGVFPRTVEEWLTLPGIGPYTSASIASQCFGVKAPVWDGNVLRVRSRMTATRAAHEKKFSSGELEKLKGWMNDADASAFNQAWMELGALVCTKAKPKCDACPINDACAAFACKKPEEYPERKARKQKIVLKPNAFVFLDHGRVFLMERKKPFWFAGLWDFPSTLGGVVEPIVTHTQESEISGQSEMIGVIRHHITHHQIEMKVFLKKGKMPANLKNQGRWVTLDALMNENTLPLATTAKKVLKALGKNVTF